MPTAVIFDFDGVIADTEPLHLRAFQQVLSNERVDLTREDYYERYLGYDDAGVFRAVGAAHGLEARGEWVAEMVIRKSSVFASLIDSDTVIFPHAAACVRRLADSMPLAIASGALHEEIRLILERTGLLDFFVTIVGADDTSRSKPAPDPYLEAVRRMRISLPTLPDSGGYVAIEDSLSGLASARSAGLLTIGVTNSYSAAALAAAADVVLPDLSGVSREWLLVLMDRLQQHHAAPRHDARHGRQ